MNTTAFIHWVLGRMGEARKNIDEALSILADADDDVSLAWSLQFLGLILSSEGEYDLADEAMQQGIAIARRLGDMTKSSFSLAFHGDVALQQGNKQRAIRVYEECLEVLSWLGNKLFTAYPLRRLGYLALERGDVRKAWSCFHESMVLNQEGGDRRAVLACVTAMAALALHMDNAETAARLLGIVDSRMESLSLNLLYLDRLELQRVRDAVQQTLDAGTLGTAYAEGWETGEDQIFRLVDATFKKSITS